MRLLLISTLAFVAACPKAGPAPVDPTLPEEASEIDRQGPLAILTEGAADTDPTPRARSLALLVQHADDATEAWAPRALYDPSPWVQRAALESLATRLPDPDAEALIEAYVQRESADPYVRAMAATLLSSPSAETVEVLSGAWRAHSEPWDVAPLALAAMIVGDDEAIAALAEAVSTGELPMETDFVLQVGHSGEPSLVDSLKQAQDRVELELELPVATALLMLGDAAGEQPLRSAVADDDPIVRLEALDYLSRLDHPSSIPLMRRASGQGPDLVRWYADLALASRTGGNTDVFDRAYEDVDREVRLLAVRFAAEAAEQGPASRKLARSTHGVIHAALSDRDAAVRAEALRAAGRLGLDGIEEAVERLLVDEAKLVRIEAAGVAMTLGIDSGGSGEKVPSG